MNTSCAIGLYYKMYQFSPAISCYRFLNIHLISLCLMNLLYYQNGINRIYRVTQSIYGMNQSNMNEDLHKSGEILCKSPRVVFIRL